MIIGVAPVEALELAECCSRLCTVVVLRDLLTSLTRLRHEPVGVLFCNLAPNVLSLPADLARRAVFLTRPSHDTSADARVAWPGLVLERPLEREGLVALVARRLGLRERLTDAIA